MPASVLPASNSTAAPRISWDELATRVRQYRPDVIIQVARKMPRLAEYFHLDFGSSCLVVSDLAIPFIHRHLRGARIAILDDVINVGSTLRHAESMTVACAPAQIKSFALGRRQAAGLNDATECVWPVPIGDSQYRSLTEFVPTVLLELPKPYDLEFPILPCRLNVPFSTIGDVRQWLENRFGAGRIVSHFLNLGRLGLARITVEAGSGQPGLFKVRLYLDMAARSCNFVPIAIPPSLKELARVDLKHSLCMNLLAAARAALSDAPPNTSVWADEPLFRALLFAHSLDYGLTELHKFQELLGLRDEQTLSIPDMNLLFGPVDFASTAAKPSPKTSNVCAFGPLGSPFATFVLNTTKGKAFLERVRNRTPATCGYSLFLAFFCELAATVGASNPQSFSLDWPFSATEIAANPYNRLRIGPTFEDLITLYSKLTRSEEKNDDLSDLRREISAYLDQAIDVGAVVPTIAQYDDVLYRVYRMGESETREKTINRVLYAWQICGTPMSLTRFTKLNAILAMSGAVPPVLSPETLARGNVAVLSQSVLDWGEAEVAAILRNTGRLREEQ